MQMQLTCTCVWPTMHAFVAPSAQTDGMASPVPASEPHMLQWFHGKASRVSKRATWHVMVASLEVGATRLALPCHFMTAVMCLDRQPRRSPAALHVQDLRKAAHQSMREAAVSQSETVRLLTEDKIAADAKAGGLKVCVQPRVPNLVRSPCPPESRTKDPLTYSHTGLPWFDRSGLTTQITYLPGTLIPRPCLSLTASG